MTETPRNPGPLTIRRVRYVYDGNDRRIGRTAEYAPLPAVGVMPEETDWRVEDRPDILASDGLPADVTYVWDPVADRLVAVFDAATGQLIRQMIHGAESYDDPLEVAVATGSSAAVKRLYPIFDESGTGSLQVVLNETGNVVARWGTPGAYGEDEYFIAGPGVEAVSRKASKSENGTLESVEIAVTLTEAIDEATIAAGARLAVLDRNGTLIRESAATARLGSEPGELRWRLTEGEWSVLLEASGEATPAILSIAITDGLRAAAWGDAPVAPVPEWAGQLYPVRTSAETPLEYRASLTEVSEWLASIPAGAERSERLYSIDALGGFGAPRDGSMSGQDGYEDPIRLMVLAPFHAHPIQEPLGGHTYVRARVFDPQTGVWLSPDPLGYKDSSNLYAFCAGDPINCSDPLGEAGFWEDAGQTLWGYAKGVSQVVAAPGVLTYNLTGALLYQTTGGEQYRQQFEGSRLMGAAVKSAALSPGNAAQLIVQGVTAGVDQMVECANRGDAECTGEGLGNLVSQTLMIAAAGGTTSMTTVPARSFATSSGVVVRGAGGAVALTSPNAGVVSSILLANAVNEGGTQEPPSAGVSERAHGHHTYPKAVGGHPRQPLAEILAGEHIGSGGVHSELAQFEGGWLYPKRRMTGAQIVERYGSAAVEEGLRRFYSQPRWRHLLDTYEEAVRFTHQQVSR
jgi:RHS repeat-associated protein